MIPLVLSFGFLFFLWAAKVGITAIIGAVRAKRKIATMNEKISKLTKK